MYVDSFFFCLKSFITISHLDYYSMLLPYSGRTSLFKWFENHLLKKGANLEHLSRKGNSKKPNIQSGGEAEQQQAAGICRAPYKQAKKYQDEEMAGVSPLLPAQLSKTKEQQPPQPQSCIFMNPRPSNCQLQQHSHLML
jgi:hypothetical protein